MVLGKQSLQRDESNRWNADGVRVENIHRNHSVGPPREKETKNNVNTIHRHFRIMLANSLSVIGLS